MKPDELPSRKAYRRLPPPKHMDTWNEGATGKIPLYFKVIVAFILSCMLISSKFSLLSIINVLPAPALFFAEVPVPL